MDEAKQRSAAVLYAQQHLRELSVDVHNWRSRGVLPEPSRLHELASLCRYLPKEADALQEAERLTVAASLSLASGTAVWSALSLAEATSKLRLTDGDSVTLLYQAADVRTGTAVATILCQGAWTGWSELAFGGETLEQALIQALMARQSADERTLASAPERGVPRAH